MCLCCASYTMKYYTERNMHKIHKYLYHTTRITPSGEIKKKNYQFHNIISRRRYRNSSRQPCRENIASVYFEDFFFCIRTYLEK